MHAKVCFYVSNALYLNVLLSLLLYSSSGPAQGLMLTQAKVLMIVEANLFLIVFLIQDFYISLLLIKYDYTIIINHSWQRAHRSRFISFDLYPWAALPAHPTMFLKLTVLTVSVLPSFKVTL